MVCCGDMPSSTASSSIPSKRALIIPLFHIKMATLAGWTIGWGLRVARRHFNHILRVRCRWSQPCSNFVIRCHLHVSGQFLACQFCPLDQYFIIIGQDWRPALQRNTTRLDVWPVRWSVAQNLQTWFPCTEHMVLLCGHSRQEIPDTRGIIISMCIEEHDQHWTTWLTVALDSACEVTLHFRHGSLLNHSEGAPLKELRNLRCLLRLVAWWSRSAIWHSRRWRLLRSCLNHSEGAPLKEWSGVCPTFRHTQISMIILSWLLFVFISHNIHIDIYIYIYDFPTIFWFFILSWLYINYIPIHPNTYPMTYPMNIPWISLYIYRWCAIFDDFAIYRWFSQ